MLLIYVVKSNMSGLMGVDLMKLLLIGGREHYLLQTY